MYVLNLLMSDPRLKLKSDRDLNLKGAYGFVLIDETKSVVTKKVEISGFGTLNEIGFLNTFCINDLSFLPMLIGYETAYDDNSLKIQMKYNGFDMSANKMNLLEKVKILPSLINQFGLILDFLLKNKIIHMDIKPHNLCLTPQLATNDYKLVLIDFGFAIAIKPFTIRHHIGSYIYADMTYHYPRIHHQSYDMYSVGMTLLVWLNLSVDEYDCDVHKYIDKYTERCNTYHTQVESHKIKRRSSGQLSKLVFPKYGIFLSVFNYYGLIEQILPTRYFTLIGKMVNYNQYKRPIPSDLINLTMSSDPSQYLNDFNPRDDTHMMPMIANEDLILIYEDDIVCSPENIVSEIEYHCHYNCQHMNMCYSEHHEHNVKRYLMHHNGPSNIRWSDINDCDFVHCQASPPI